jgi:hypothetical protein
VIDHDVEGNVPWIAYEYLPGRTLRHAIRRGNIPWREAVGIAAQIASALREIHQTEIIHRDIKPENIMEQATGHWVVTDFGLAKSALGETVRTQAGQILGTPDYLAPELIVGKAATFACDLYSLGVVLYEMLTGIPPFSGEDTVKVLKNHLERTPEDISRLLPEAPEGLSLIISRAMAKRPEDRFQSAGQFAQTLEAIADGTFTAIPGRVHSRRPSSRAGVRPATKPTIRTTTLRPRAMYVAAGAALLAIAGGGWFLARHPPVPVPVPSPSVPLPVATPSRRHPRAPGGRSNAAMVYDEVQEKILLFGGAVPTAFGTPEARDAWTFDGAEWTPIRETHPGNSWPTFRYRHSMCTDPVRKRVLLFGGRNQDGALGDTWEWDGARWTDLAPQRSATPRGGAQMVYEPFGGHILLLGDRISRTMCWNGQQWRQEGALTSPPVLANPVMATDEARSRIVLFGSHHSKDQQTWEYDGRTWKQVFTPSSPPWANSSQMVYDAARKVILLFGGAITNATWEYDGVRWTKRTPDVSPAPRMDHSMAYDRKRQRVVVFGGHGKSRSMGDTWEWDGTNWKLACPPAE